MIQKFPATVVLLLINISVFIYTRYIIGTFSEPLWSQGLLFNGAEFAPLSLDKEWYRLFTHMFMHGSIAHLLFNMYALFIVGSEVERITGTKKFLLIYFICGFTASLASLYFNLFVVGVGASGAIFGLFGYSLVVDLVESRKSDKPVMPIVINFIIFLVINLLFAKALNADNAAHMGGLAGGIVLGVFSLLNASYQTIRVEWALIPVCGLLFSVLPKYQVTYFNFFQKILNIEDSTQALYKIPNLANEKFLERYKSYQPEWDSALLMLAAHTYLPEALNADTTKLKRYIELRKQESDFRILMIENESYRYMDSIEFAQEQMRPYYKLDYPLTQLRPIKPQKRDTSNLVPKEIWYDENWEEIDGPPGSYYRAGTVDSLDRWQGPLQDYYGNGSVQMKGSYTNSQRDGIFIYYTDHNTYSSAGRYSNERAVGKWENFYDNGQLKSEEYFLDDYYMKNMWDSLGYYIVKDGAGRFVAHYPNGVISETGNYKEGQKEGVWEGRHKNGSPYFEEFFNQGRLVSGRSRLLDGQTFVYDQSSLYPMPEGGNTKLLAHIKKELSRIDSSVHGKVVLAFRVSFSRVLINFTIDKSLTPELDAKAIEIIKSGPAWMPGRDHGHLAQNGWGWVTIEF